MPGRHLWTSRFVYEYSCYLVLLCLIIYSTVRTNTLSVTYDEAATYLWHVHYSFWHIVQFSTSGLPDNNHILLTLSAKLSLAAFGDTLFSLRLPSAIGYAAYCISATAVLRRSVHGFTLILFLLFVALNTELVDIMSIARGYGIGIALTTMGVYALLRSRQSATRTAWTWAAALLFGLAVLAHLSLLLFYGVAVCIIGAELLLDVLTARISWRGFLIGAAGPTAVSLALAPIITRQIVVLQPLGLLNTEGLTSFHFDTVKMVIAGSLFHGDMTQPLIGLICLFAYGMPLCGLLALVVSDYQVARLWTPRRDLAVFLTFLIGVSLGSVLQHHFFGVAFLSGRRAICLFPSFVFCTAGILNFALSGPFILRRLAGPGLVAVVVVMTAQFARAARFDKTNDWGFDADVNTMVQDVTAISKCNNWHPFRLGTDWLFDSAINYFIARDHITLIQPVDQLDHSPLANHLEHGEKAGGFDAFYIRSADLPILERGFGLQKVLQHYEVSDTILTTSTDSPKNFCDCARPLAAILP